MVDPELPDNFGKGPDVRHFFPDLADGERLDFIQAHYAKLSFRKDTGAWRITFRYCGIVIAEQGLMVREVVDSAMDAAAARLRAVGNGNL